MEGKMNVKETTYNTIFVTWNSKMESDYMEQYNRNLISPSFTLTIDGYPICFALSIQCQQNFIVRVHQNSLRVGRAIVLVAVKANTYCVDAGKTSFIEKWEETCVFYNLGYLSKVKSSHSLTIDCKIIWLGFVSNIESSNPSVSPLAVATTFSDNKIFPDFTIIVGGQEIPSHKAILARHSPVFSTMFETPMKEVKENKIIIEDIEFSTMDILLKIIYTGNAEDLTDVDVILKVLHAVEKYQISTIKSLCTRKLQLLIDEKNVLKLLEIGDKFNASELCETCIAYIMIIRNGEILTKFKRISRDKPNIAFAAVDVLTELSSFLPIQND